jgi:4-alpha-methyl-delta7-sterol-4alpha-methyl oxidase
MEATWQFLRSFPLLKDDRNMFIIGSFLVHEIMFIGLNIIFYIFHHFNLFERYKIQKGRFPAPRLVRSCLINLAVSQFITQPIALYFVYPLFVKFGMRFDNNMPDAMEIIKTFAVAIVINDTLFYWAHRFLHISWLYKRIHSQHHRFTITIGIAAEFAHPVESILANTIPTILGPLLMGPHVMTLWIWLIVRIFETVEAHSGYDFPFSPFSGWLPTNGADRHDYHHSHNEANFGSFFTFWDWLMGTDKPYLEWKRKQRQEQQPVAKKAE